ncbi:monovalent cation:proton antiporter family protein [Xylanibacillus composti]|uniref:monovalent cation:proton antiporter family protein n=1 Tax=Xylanibacillus composti TaxID=1572762 RepID=UPI001FD51BD5|nr:monovalent cation:proton antiporter family protein [Xylanibacillus composti]
MAIEEHASLTSLLIVVAAAFLIPILLRVFRLKLIPVVVAEIVVGLIIGHSGFNIIQEDEMLGLLSMFGFIYLMFLSGLEIDFQALSRKKSRKKDEVNPLLPAFLVFVGIMIVSFGLAYGLVLIGLVSEPYLMTLIIATISLGVVMPVIKERKLMDKPLGQILLLITVLSDLATMILLAVFVSVRSQNTVQMLYLLLFFIFVLFVYLLIRWLAKGDRLDFLRKSTSQMGTRAVFALILLLVVMSETLEVEMILGAFLAGVIVSLMAPNKRFKHQLESFGYGFLIPIFFVMVGVRLDLGELFADRQILLFIPLLVAAIFISKLVPSLILRKWYPWRQVFASGFLVSSTLSLVIAAAAIAAQLEIISPSMEGALILAAVITCLIAPVIFNHLFPEQEAERKAIAIVGANHITLPVSQDLMREGYDVLLYSSQPPTERVESKEEKYSRFPLIEVPKLEKDSLQQAGLFDADTVVFGTMDDEVNIRLAEAAKQFGHRQIIVRVEDPEKHELLAREEGVRVISTLYASRTLLKAMIEHPSALKLITHHDDSVQEVEVNNPAYNLVSLRDLPVLGDTLVMRIYRGDSFVIPHGSTQIMLGDRLLVSGSVEHIQDMKRELG